MSFKSRDGIILSTTLGKKMHISRVIVKKLNGSISYDIPFHPSGITLITGPNGYGKTSVLRLIDAMFNIRLDTFAQITFEEVEIELSDGSGLAVRKLSEVLEGFNLSFGTRSSRKKAFHFQSKDFSFDDFAAESDGSNSYSLSFDKFIREKERKGTIRRLPGGRWRGRSGEALALEDLQVEFMKSSAALEEVPDEYLSVVRNSIPLFLSAHRLHGSDQATAVDLVAEQVRSQIKLARDEHSKASQRIDQDFPRKLLSRSELIPCTELEVRQAFDRLAESWTRYRDLGLLQEPSFEGFGKGIQKDRLSIAMLFLEDQRKKLEVFALIEKRLMLFRALVDEHLELNKTVTFSDIKGIEIIDTRGTPIPLTRLSSGEQQLLVLFATLLFCEPLPSFVLIDEPELSLHPSWQKSFVENIERIRELVEVDFVLATHSPTIVDGRLDQMVDLWMAQK